MADAKNYLTEKIYIKPISKPEETFQQETLMKIPTNSQKDRN